MEQKQRFFIYDRKELWVLVLLGVMVAIFAFTLGVHLGKRVTTQTNVAHNGEVTPVQTLPDETLSKQELSDEAKHAEKTADETLHESAYEEVNKTGIKLDQAKPTELPSGAPAAAQPGGPAGDGAAAPAAPIDGKFTLQVGSHGSLDEAQQQVAALVSLALKTFIRDIEVKGKGRRFRVFLGGYETKEQAERTGKRLTGQHVIDSYVVQPMSAAALTTSE